MIDNIHDVTRTGTISQCVYARRSGLFGKMLWRGGGWGVRLFGRVGTDGSIMSWRAERGDTRLWICIVRCTV